jgi:hypothetical protein
MDPVWQKFRAAALVLARSGTLKERLHAAYRCELADLDVEALPDELRRDFIELRDALTREKPLRGEDAVTATIRKLSAQDADDIASRLIDIFARLSGVAAALPVRAAVSAPPVSAQVIPLFAVAAEA